MAKRWKIRPHDAARILDLERAAGVPSVVAQLLLCRGIEHPQAISRFLDTRLSTLRSPDELPGLATAADFITAAIHAGRHITIYGDYDADGMTATAILVRCLRLLQAHVDFHIPNRLNEGYGLNADALRELAKRGTQLIITVDCGVASVPEAELARELGMELVITDHHMPGKTLPPAVAIVHPGLPDSEYPFAGLCGAGVAFKLAWALCQRISGTERVAPRHREMLLSTMGIAAIGTVADVVPMLDENRILVHHGLTRLQNSPYPGVAALIQVAGLQDRPALSSEDIAFMMAPRLNAAGRLGQAELAVELLTTDDATRAEQLALYIHDLNKQRDTLERSIYLAAQKQVKEQFDPTQDPALVLAGHGWHVGVIGIVAGRLAERYCRPVVMIALDELGRRIGTGSARSAFGLNLYEALDDCSSYLDGFGGHAAAAGLRIDEGQIDGFRAHFCQHIASRVSPDERVAELHVDAETTLPQLTLRTVKQIEQLAPFGQLNPRPLLCSSRVRIDGDPRRIGAGERHLSLTLAQGELKMRGVAFGHGEWADPLSQHGGEIDVVFRPVINEFRGRRTVEVQLVDWRPAV